VLVVEDVAGKHFVTVAPVTHSAPDNPAAAVEIPFATKRRLGLDDARSWVLVSEGNRFIWPGPDVRPITPGRFDYGFLPPALFDRIQRQFDAYLVAKRLQAIPRTE
jgi:hypothetical protein